MLGAAALLACGPERAALGTPMTVAPYDAPACADALGASAATVRWTGFRSVGAATPAAWCAAVGPALTLAPEHAQTGPIAPSALTVVTWNVRAGAGDVERFVRDLRSGALTGEPVDAFVLLLQEAYRAGPEVPLGVGGEALTSRIEVSPPTGERLGVAALSRRLGLHAFYAPSMPNGAGEGPEGRPARGRRIAEDRGNAILSTLPLTDLAALELPFEVQRRVAVSATVTAVGPGGEPVRLRVASGHLDTRSRWSRFLDSFGAGRSRQAGALGAWLEGDAVVLGADLNTWSAPFLEGALDLLLPRFPDTPEAEGATFTAVGGLVRRKLDRLMARLPEGHVAEVRRVSDRYGSDHYPLLGRVGFAAPSPASVAATAP